MPQAYVVGSRVSCAGCPCPILPAPLPGPKRVGRLAIVASTLFTLGVEVIFVALFGGPPGPPS